MRLYLPIYYDHFLIALESFNFSVKRTELRIANEKVEMKLFAQIVQQNN